MIEERMALPLPKPGGTTTMARITHPVFQQLSGSIGGQLVFKQYGDKTVVSKFPDMSRVTPSHRQQAGRSLFAEAVAFAKTINNDPVKKAQYQQMIGKGRSVYHYALQEYMKQAKNG